MLLFFSIKSICFDENYHPADNTRMTTNFANLARGQSRQENLRNTLRMISNRFNSLAHWDNPNGDRYAVELEIISVEMNIEVEGGNIPLLMVICCPDFCERAAQAYCLPSAGKCALLRFTVDGLYHACRDALTR